MAAGRTASRGRAWRLALVGLCTVVLPIAARAADQIAKAPDWPNLLSEAGRRAAMALPPSSPFHLEPALGDLEPAPAAPVLSAKERYDRWLAAGSPPNVRANDPTGDQFLTAADTQSECAVAAHGTNVVVAWNDSKGLRLGTPTTVTSYAYSCDGGQTFTDGGNVPLIAAGNQSFGDCTLDVDNVGNFYLGVIYVGATQDVGVYRGTFGGGCSFSWGTPAIAANGAAGALDKPYLCVNPVDGNVYVSYTRFGATTNIEVVRGTGLGTVWTAPVVLDNTSGSQASRPIVGPEGNLYVAWAANWGFINCDLSATTNGEIRFRRSTNPAGAFTFGGTILAGAVGHNWTSYWGGNLRNFGHYMPDMGVDRSGGVHNGNIYVAWNEAAPWGPPGAGTGVSVAETEVNNAPGDAGVKFINLGDNATGTISASSDFDYWKMNLVAGQHVMLRLEPQGFNCGVTGTTRNFQIRLFAGAAAETLLANSNLNGFVSEIVFDVPRTATYFFRIRNVNTAGTVTGTYTVKSRSLTYLPAVARDMRDIVCVRSTNLGVSFGGKVLVNDTAANLDECIPAVVVDDVGKVHVFYYDVRDANAHRMLRSYYHNRSLDGGLSFGTGQRISNELMYFNLNTVAVPNYGEYNQAAVARANPDNRVYTTWSDERVSQAPPSATTSGVDAYVAALQSCVSVSCAPDVSVPSGTPVGFNVCITNCGNFADDFPYTITDSQGWCAPMAGTVTNLAPGAMQCIAVNCNVPITAVDGEFTDVTLSASSASCPTDIASCITRITVQNPSGLPGAGEDCFQSTAVVQVEIFGVGTTTLNLTGPTMVQRGAPTPGGPGFQIQTEMVSMELTGFNPLLGPVALHESPLYVTKGRIDTPPGPFFPAQSFFDVFMEIDVAGMTLYNKNRLRVEATINAIPPVGDPYQGNDILLYRKGPSGNANPVGRVISEIHTPGPPFEWFPPPGSDCLQSLVEMQVSTIFGSDTMVGSGPMMVTRAAAIDPGDGRPEIETEMVSMELVGSGPVLGPFRLIESPTQASPGQMKSQLVGNNYPMDSFFDVFFEVELPSFGATVIGAGPANMRAVINAIPPLGTPYLNTAPIQLLDKNTLAPVGTLQIVRHTPTDEVEWVPPPDTDCFTSTAQVTVEITGVGTDVVSLSGPTMILRGPGHDLGGGMLRFDTEMLSMSLTGFSPLFGAVTVEEDIDRPSVGQVNGLSPGQPFPADSFFDVFFVLTTPLGVLRPQVAVRMANPALPTLPPPPGTQYQGINNPILLVDSHGVVRGRLLAEIHETGTPVEWTTDTPLDREASGFYGVRGAYPNPFVSATQVSFRLDRERDVKLRVFNVRGELVRTVHSGRLGAGARTLGWDGKDEVGRTVGTGVYFYRLEIDGEGLTRKVIKMQ